MTLNKVKIKVPTSVTMPLKDKFKFMTILKRDPFPCQLLLKQGMAWFPLMSEDANEPV